MQEIKIEISLPIQEALTAVKEALKKEGFGVITEINAKATLKEKLGVDFEEYYILGVCKPDFAYALLTINKEIGKHLPCNILVYRKGDMTIISAINPLEALASEENLQVQEIARDASKSIKKAINSIKN